MARSATCRLPRLQRHIGMQILSDELKLCIGSEATQALVLCVFDVRLSLPSPFIPQCVDELLERVRVCPRRRASTTLISF